jgi:hypothetical protein
LNFDRERPYQDPLALVEHARGDFVHALLIESGTPLDCCTYVRKFLPGHRPHVTQSGHCTVTNGNQVTAPTKITSIVAFAGGLSSKS